MDSAVASQSNIRRTSDSQSSDRSRAVQRAPQMDPVHQSDNVQDTSYLIRWSRDAVEEMGYAICMLLLTGYVCYNEIPKRVSSTKANGVQASLRSCQGNG